MTRPHKLLCYAVGLLLWCISYTTAVDTIRVVTYNILNFPDGLGISRLPHLRTVINYIQLDILVCQELCSEYGVNLLLDSVLNYETVEFTAVPFHDGPDTDNGLFYRSYKVSFDSAHYIQTSIRDIAEYFLHTMSGDEFRILSVHLKSSSDDWSTNERRREAQILRQHLNSCAPGSYFLVVGDFNIYYSDEPAFHVLTDSTDNNNGRLYDPINAYGYWHNNSQFAHIHTQSTRVAPLEDGGVGGGLDDRFDMILCSKSFLDTMGLVLLVNTYTTVGNDGAHLNQSINSGTNLSVPSYVADALYYASDHLPVYVDIEVRSTAIIDTVEQLDWVQSCSTCFGVLRIDYYIPSAGCVSLQLYNDIGQCVATIFKGYQPRGKHSITYDISRLYADTYFCRIATDDYTVTRKVVILK